MCLAIPGKIESVSGDDPLTRMGRINFGGILKEACLAYVPEVKVGDYVIVHVGFALSRLDEAEAHKVFEYLKQMDELALELGSVIPQIKAVVAYVPANVRRAACCGNTRVPYAWTWQGQPLAYESGRGARRNLEVAMRAVITVEYTINPWIYSKRTRPALFNDPLNQ